VPAHQREVQNFNPSITKNKNKNKKMLQPILLWKTPKYQWWGMESIRSQTQRGFCLPDQGLLPLGTGNNNMFTKTSELP
jgi:hypothetical protein